MLAVWLSASDADIGELLREVGDVELSEVPELQDGMAVGAFFSTCRALRGEVEHLNIEGK